MFVLFIVLNKTEYVEDILAKFLEIGVSGATILDSQGMACAMAETDLSPMFSFIKTMVSDSRPYSKTIFTVLDSREMLDTTVAAVKESLEEDVKQGDGFMFCMPVDSVYSFGEA